MNPEAPYSGTNPSVQRMEIARVGVLSVAKVAAAVYAVIAFISAIFLALGILAAASTAQGLGAGGGPRFGPALALGVLIIAPIGYAILGFIFGAISALVYNLVSSKIGGIVLHTRQP